VTGSGSDTADLELKVRLVNFVQRFMSRNHSFGVLDARISLANVKSGDILAQKNFHYEVTAPTADAQGGVQALGVASGKLTGQVKQWVQDVLAD
jgi:cholesterol transport system auxiliary component